MAAITNVYRMKVYGPIEQDSQTWTNVDWNDFQAAYKGDVDIRIPHYDKANVTDIQDCFGANLINFLTLIPTDDFYKLDRAIPFGYYNSIGVKYNSVPLTASYAAERYFYYTDVRAMLNLDSLDISKNYVVAIANDNSDYFAITLLTCSQGFWFISEGWFSILKSNNNLGAGLYIPTANSGKNNDPNVPYSYGNLMLFTYGNDNWYWYRIYGPSYPNTNYVLTQWNFHGNLTTEQKQYLKAVLGLPIVIDPSNPYPDIPDSGQDQGGNGEQDFSSEETPMSSLPSLSAADTGFTRLFNPTLAQLQDFAAYVWSDSTFLQTVLNQLVQIFEKPMDYFISLNVLPCNVSNTANPVEVKLLFIPTGKSMYGVTNQFTDVDCGYCKIPMQFDSALDNSPYTKVQLYLPYIGMVSLNADEVVGHVIHVTYRVDVFSGGCTAMVGVLDGSTENIRYCYSGHCAINIPFTSANYSTYVGALIQTAKLAGSVAAGAAGAMGVADAIAGLPEPKSSETRSVKENADGETMYAKTTVHHSSGASMSSIVTHGLVNTAASIMGAKPQIERSGTFSGNTGYLGLRYPYIIMESPNLCTPNEYGMLNGRPSLQYLRLADLSGYTKVQQMVLNGFGATNPELDEIGTLLKAGVYL